MPETTPLRVLNDRLHTALLKVISDLDDEQLRFKAPIIDERPIADVAIHAYHSLVGFVTIASGQSQAWPETPATPKTKDALLGELARMHGWVDELLALLTNEAMYHTIRLPWGQEGTREDIIADGLVHGLIHTGAIQGLRALGGFPVPPQTH